MKVCQNQLFSLFLLPPAPTPSPLFSGRFLLRPLPDRSRQRQGPKELGASNLRPFSWRCQRIQSCFPPWNFICTDWGYSLSPDHCPESVPLSRTQVGAAWEGQGHCTHARADTDGGSKRTRVCTHACAVLAPAGEGDARGPPEQT